MNIIFILFYYIFINLFKDGFKSYISKKEDIIEEKDGVKYHMTTSDSQKNNTNKNISTLDLGDCEKELKT